MDAEGDDYYNCRLNGNFYQQVSVEWYNCEPYTAASVKLGYQHLFCSSGFDSVFHINYLFYLDLYVI